MLDRRRDEMRTSGAEGVGHDVVPKLRLPSGGGDGGCSRNAGFELSPSDATVCVMEARSSHTVLPLILMLRAGSPLAAACAS
jgi:hypothetical protein